jgi:hypothetical protein
VGLLEASSLRARPSDGPPPALSLSNFFNIIFFIYLKIYDIVPRDLRPGCSMTVTDVARGTISNRCMIQYMFF